MSKNRMIFYTALLMVNSMWFQFGGIGIGSIINADDITLRQATCEIISMTALFASFILIAIIPKEESK
jgi:hypothetical protein